MDPYPTENVTGYAYLVEYTSKTIINGGFQGGEVRVLRAGNSSITFNALKLNKMGPIKSELNSKNFKQLSATFCIMFKLANR